MPGIANTVRRLRSGQFDGSAQRAPTSPRLQQLSAFGSNPGALNGWLFVPGGGIDMALVVVLHGCTQNATGYDHGSGWSDLAERFGFAALFPEQRRANNPNLCFNWFNAHDATRDAGEALSIRQMIGAVTAQQPIDPARVFVTGLSAGGAMTSVMLATYPELFAGGAVIAGLPFGAATSIPTALEQMRGHGHMTASAFSAAIRAASPHKGRWPTMSVWHGTADRTVDVSNAEAILGQWRGVHGSADNPDLVDLIDGQQHRAWFGQDGEIVVEDYRVAGLGHGTPLDTHGAEGCGNVGPHMLQAGISSTWRQAQRWGLIDASSRVTSTWKDRRPSASLAEPRFADTAFPLPSAAGVNATIERALRSAGLLR